MTGAGKHRAWPPTTVLLAYALPGLPLAALTLPLYIYLPSFYAEDLGLGFALVGGLLLAARLWDMITDPLVGALSDRLDTTWGRRRPWLIAGTPLVMVSLWFLFDPPADASGTYLLVWTMALYLAATFVRLPYEAWGAELSPDYDGRSRVTGHREAFVVLGTLLATGIPALTATTKVEALQGLAWLTLLTLPVAVGLACWLVPDPPSRQSARVPWRDGLRVLAANAPFRRLILAYFLNGIANGLPATLFLLFVERVLVLPEWAGPLLFVYFVCGLAAVPVWLRLSYRYGKHRIWALAMVGTSLVFATVPLLGPGDELWFAAICVLTGIGLGADLVLPPAMQADVVDLDRLESGAQRTGLYFALWGVATKLALALAVGLAFPALELAGFQPRNVAPDSTSGLLALALLYGLVPVAFKLVSIGLMWGFPITRDRQAEVRRLIAQQA